MIFHPNRSLEIGEMPKLVGVASQQSESGSESDLDGGVANVFG